ncbi:unnamed protein product [Acanthoscelides obtectus]|uniref:Methyltransferase-like protein 9 n=1 Tax=Acanthoscelides obtectus TaxID=200917 RepID=A0A9P0PZ32_ACAOB|nr:unnamed protein product [Acanthoscelides obtectus]CAK1668455.1 Methyltransferase-like protein 9 [Acanthoscelides obtectus]
MFVASQPQFKKLLGANEDWRAESLVDLGAGDGEVTAKIDSLFEKVYVTEMSGPMRTLLQKKGYEILDLDSWHLAKKYDMISCLNLIDRCTTPLTLMRQMKTALKSNGMLLLAVVLPFSAYVESEFPDHKPKEHLPIIGDTFEEQVKNLVENVLVPEGYEVVSWSRVPYLCEGDLQQSYYWLDDAIFVLKQRH